jgi:mutator protein MutT
MKKRRRNLRLFYGSHNMKTLQIAVGIIRNPQNQIFITQRAADAHMANKWEFPGGKSSR